MPSTLLEIRREYTPSQELALMDAVHGAPVAAFRIPEADNNVRLENWGIRGGQAACDIELGFDVNV